MYVYLMEESVSSSLTGPCRWGYMSLLWVRVSRTTSPVFDDCKPVFSLTISEVITLQGALMDSLRQGVVPSHATISACHQCREDWLSWVQVSSRTRCSFSVCGICLQCWLSSYDIGLVSGSA